MQVLHANAPDFTRLRVDYTTVFTIARVLNHAEGGVTKIYARASYLNEKRAALEKWAEYLSRIIGETTVPFEGRASG